MNSATAGAAWGDAVLTNTGFGGYVVGSSQTPKWAGVDALGAYGASPRPWDWSQASPTFDYDVQGMPGGYAYRIYASGAVKILQGAGAGRTHSAGSSAANAIIAQVERMRPPIYFAGTIAQQTPASSTSVTSSTWTAPTQAGGNLPGVSNAAGANRATSNTSGGGGAVVAQTFATLLPTLTASLTPLIAQGASQIGQGGTPDGLQRQLQVKMGQLGTTTNPARRAQLQAEIASIQQQLGLYAQVAQAAGVPVTLPPVQAPAAAGGVPVWAIVGGVSVLTVAGLVAVLAGRRRR